ncbi:SDR family NAD(P)-dependent oxidoreductase [Paenactinomyces guangxiensis]|uniref:SDR family oxidoreductase n=1 Tax=Paenactinomyces guangxiensis TaxID=1490290 RepID=A0A7W1WQP3_9BACL|nr:SDR family oxidoreductase [Paenactinomyces guangxiensis]MBA4494305.1 SDR family oxidoreductase [Paenactinomyces guangxiensis]MBH8590799.1 SDR family oxidoreductase [Paenactinomyces guangxiensis]
MFDPPLPPDIPRLKICEPDQGDIFNEKDLTKLYKEIFDRYGHLDGLVNSAGIIFPDGIEELGIEKWKQTMDVNLTGAYMVTQRLLPLLKESKYPSIVNISSISSKLAGSSIAYSVSKAGMDMLTKAVAKELAKYRIRVNSVNPGMVSSGFQVSNGVMERQEYDQFLSGVCKTYPFGMGELQDIANAVYFLMSPEAKWITGSIMMVDGGKSISG